MIVVSDTTPLNYLVLINEVDVIHNIFNEVFIPPEVRRELLHAKTPQIVRQWIQNSPSWLVVKAPVHIDPATSSLDRGESEAISLAKELNVSLILMDERKGAAVARSERLTVVRTLGLLEIAASRNLVDLPSVVNKLKSTNFRISQDHIDAALHRDILRKAKGH